MTPPKPIDPFANAEISFSQDPFGETGLVESGDTITIDGSEMPVDIFVQYGEDDFPGTTFKQRLYKVLKVAAASELCTTLRVSEELQLLENEWTNNGFVPVYDELGELSFRSFDLFVRNPWTNRYERIPDLLTFGLSEYILRQLPDPFVVVANVSTWAPFGQCPGPTDWK
jgi:hypothetical protein